MSRYAPQRPEPVQQFIEFALAWLEHRRYTLTVDVDMARWARTMAEAVTEQSVNPSFNPRFSRLSPNNSFWLDIRAGSQTIATSAARHFTTGDLLQLVRSMKLWRETPRPEDGDLTVASPPHMPLICGSVGHEGGLWVHPRHRKLGLSAILPRLTRALCLRQWGTDWLTGVARRGIGECGIAKWSYGYPHVELCFDGYFPPTRGRERLYLCYMNRDELVAGLDPQTLPRFQPHGDQETADAAARIQQG
jgi:hypothetical protein